MSGHSKWANIKRKKGVEDVKRGQLFTKLGRGIAVAARQGGADPDHNPTLRTAISKAQAANMPRERILKAVAAGGESSSTGTSGGNRWEEVSLEGYGPAGVAVLVRAVTNNRNRTAGEVRKIFTQFGGTLGERGSTAYIFSQDPVHPQFLIPVPDPAKFQRLEGLVGELRGLDDVQEVYTNIQK